MFVKTKSAGPKPDLDSRLFLTPDEAAELLLVSRRTLEREIVHGRFPRPLKVGRSCRIFVTDFAAYVQSLRVPAARAPFVGTPFRDPTGQDVEILRLIHRVVAQHQPQPPPAPLG